MIVIGASASAVDISRDIASVAKEVHIADRSARTSTCEQQPEYDNMWLHSMVNAFFRGELNMVALSVKGTAIITTDYKAYCYNKIMFYLQIDHAQGDGTVVFRDGSSIKADVIMHCTGYSHAAYLKHISCTNHPISLR